MWRSYRAIYFSRLALVFKSRIFPSCARIWGNLFQWPCGHYPGSPPAWPLSHLFNLAACRRTRPGPSGDEGHRPTIWCIHQIGLNAHEHKVKVHFPHFHYRHLHFGPHSGCSPKIPDGLAFDFWIWTCASWEVRWHAKTYWSVQSALWTRGDELHWHLRSRLPSMR